MTTNLIINLRSHAERISPEGTYPDGLVTLPVAAITAAADELERLAKLVVDNAWHSSPNGDGTPIPVCGYCHAHSWGEIHNPDCVVWALEL